MTRSSDTPTPHGTAPATSEPFSRICPTCARILTECLTDAEERAFVCFNSSCNNLRVIVLRPTPTASSTTGSVEPTRGGVHPCPHCTASCCCAEGNEGSPCIHSATVGCGTPVSEGTLTICEESDAGGFCGALRPCPLHEPEASKAYHDAARARVGQVCTPDGYPGRASRSTEEPDGAATQIPAAVEAVIDAYVEKAQRPGLRGYIRELLAHVATLQQQHAEQDARVAELEAALATFVDDDECSLDHHGNCQMHSLGNPCNVAVARRLLAARSTPSDGTANG